MGNDFTNNGCGSLEVSSPYHPLTVAYIEARRLFGNNMQPQECLALDNIVKSGIDVPFQAFETDENGYYQNDLLIGCRFIDVDGGNMPMDIVGGQITLDPETGEVQSIYASQTHTAVIGYFITGLPQLMPELDA